jgi:hypothetical protein
MAMGDKSTKLNEEKQVRSNQIAVAFLLIVFASWENESAQDIGYLYTSSGCCHNFALLVH